MLFLRRLYSRQPVSRKYFKKNTVDPGILKQKRILDGFDKDYENIDFDELESDFMNVHQSHREHVKQMNQWLEKEKHLIVKQKYFKESFPNFLTWHDKEQIRYLHNTDPEQWNVEALSEGFPALPDTIKKIIKSKGTKKTESKIANHDKAVIQNWTEFKQRKMINLPDQLKRHLQKFSDRSLNLEPFKKTVSNDNIINISKKAVEEFSEIITSYEELKNKNSQKNEVLKEEKPNSQELFELSMKPPCNNRKLTTLTALREKIKADSLDWSDISVQDKLILAEATCNNSKSVNLNPEEISKIIEKRYQTNNDKVGFVKKTTRDMSYLMYPEKIIIPKKCYKKGYTYKLNDCYYDSDGEFLYRVPGMC